MHFPLNYICIKNTISNNLLCLYNLDGSAFLFCVNEQMFEFVSKYILYVRSDCAYSTCCMCAVTVLTVREI